MLSYIEKGYLDELFNRDGYVLDFSTNGFDEFTFQIIGIRLCEKYCLSKGKSLREFTNTEDPYKIDKLYNDLLEYYSVYFSDELEENKKNNRGTSFKSLYNKCKDIIIRELSNSSNFISESEVLKIKFSSEYINSQIDLMLEMVDRNPTEAIGKSKELLESCCKEICNNLGDNKKDNLKLTQLVKETFKCLKIPNESMIIDETEDKIVKQITGSLNGLASGINDLRNHYGSGHGRERNFKALSKKHAELSVGASITLTRYLWDSFREIENSKNL